MQLSTMVLSLSSGRASAHHSMFEPNAALRAPRSRRLWSVEHKYVASGPWCVQLLGVAIMKKTSDYDACEDIRDSYRTDSSKNEVSRNSTEYVLMSHKTPAIVRT